MVPRRLVTLAFRRTVRGPDLDSHFHRLAPCFPHLSSWSSSSRVKPCRIPCCYCDHCHRENSTLLHCPIEDLLIWQVRCRLHCFARNLLPAGNTISERLVVVLAPSFAASFLPSSEHCTAPANIGRHVQKQVVDVWGSLDRGIWLLKCSPLSSCFMCVFVVLVLFGGRAVIVLRGDRYAIARNIKLSSCCCGYRITL